MLSEIYPTKMRKILQLVLIPSSAYQLLLLLLGIIISKCYYRRFPIPKAQLPTVNRVIKTELNTHYDTICFPFRINLPRKLTHTKNKKKKYKYLLTN